MFHLILIPLLSTTNTLDSLFEMFTIYFQVNSSHKNKPGSIPPQPNLSAGEASRVFALFIPGVSQGVLAFVVFGTTRTLLDYALPLLVPQRIRDRGQAKKAGQAGGAPADMRMASNMDYLRFDTESRSGTATRLGRLQEGLDSREMDGIR